VEQNQLVDDLLCADRPVHRCQSAERSVSAGQSATFTVVAGGSAPLIYQWYFNTNTPVPNATNAILTVTNVQAANVGIYSVIVSNATSSVTSTNVTLAITSSNHPPAPGSYAVATGQNIPVTIPVANLLAVGSDPDGDAISITAVNSVSTNSGTVALAGGQITYTPPLNYVGSDLFSYTLTDANNASTLGNVAVTVVSLNSIILNITGPPSLANGLFQVSYTGVPNLTYSVDRATNLAGSWQLNYTNLTADTNGLFQLMDSNNPPAPVQFYRTHYP
jgi:hypothetical protein